MVAVETGDHRRTEFYGPNNSPCRGRGAGVERATGADTQTVSLALLKLLLGICFWVGSLRAPLEGSERGERGLLPPMLEIFPGVVVIPAEEGAPYATGDTVENPALSGVNKSAASSSYLALLGICFWGRPLEQSLGRTGGRGKGG